MSIHAIEHPARPSARLPVAARRQLPWIAVGVAIGFLVPFVFADRLSIQRDVYYAIYAVVVLGFIGAWAHATEQPLREMARRRWRLAVLLGLVFGAVLAFMVLRAADPTTRPAGMTLVGAVLWRGVVYGAIDGLWLSSFPIVAVFAAFEGTQIRERRRGKLLIGVVALIASLGMTAAYHLGYSDFRSAKVPIADRRRRRVEHAHVVDAQPDRRADRARDHARDCRAAQLPNRPVPAAARVTATLCRAPFRRAEPARNRSRSSGFAVSAGRDGRLGASGVLPQFPRRLTTGQRRSRGG